MTLGTAGFYPGESAGSSAGNAMRAGLHDEISMDMTVRLAWVWAKR